MADQGLTLEELCLQAQELAELEGYANTTRRPVWKPLINKAYREFVWETECRRCMDTFVTVKDQAEYTLTTPHWKWITKAIYDGLSGFPLERTSEMEIDRDDDLWLVRTSGTPDRIVQTGPSTVRLHLPPDTAGIVVTFYGVRAPDPLDLDTDYPLIPAVYHDGLAERAYWYQALRWARGEARAALEDKVREYLSYLARCKRVMGQNVIAGTRRMTPAPEPAFVRV